MILAQNHQQQLSGSKKLIYFFSFIFLALAACSPKTVPVKKTLEQPTTNQPAEEKPAVKEQPAKPETKMEVQISMLLPFDLDNVNYRTATLLDLKKS
jgi:hypothetical protein